MADAVLAYAVRSSDVSEQYPSGEQLITEERTEERSAIRIARTHVLGPGTAGHRQ
ncbi:MULTISPECIES: hypothetical protein [unclassified Streptomyces]|uniref:hypothetical protein n=1 Tax=unclassified Streptomyces TaxID=2593676 RepID=UPI00131CC8D4|nr:MULTISPECIES: hypothetical protein [unclassified Streptomyces]